MAAVLVLSGTMRRGTPPIASGARVIDTDPIRQPLGPGRLDIGEVQGAEHGDEDPASQISPVSRSINYRRPVTGVIDEQFLAAGMGPWCIVTESLPSHDR